MSEVTVLDLSSFLYIFLWHPELGSSCSWRLPNSSYLIRSSTNFYANLVISTSIAIGFIPHFFLNPLHDLVAAFYCSTTTGSKSLVSSFATSSTKASASSINLSNTASSSSNFFYSSSNFFYSSSNFFYSSSNFFYSSSNFFMSSSNYLYSSSNFFVLLQISSFLLRIFSILHQISF